MKAPPTPPAPEEISYGRSIAPDGSIIRGGTELVQIGTHCATVERLNGWERWPEGALLQEGDWQDCPHCGPPCQLRVIRRPRLLVRGPVRNRAARRRTRKMIRRGYGIALKLKTRRRLSRDQARFLRGNHQIVMAQVMRIEAAMEKILDSRD